MTLSPADWELLHREMDGETTEKESAELEKRLAREPELATSHRALLGLGRTMSQVGLVDPPPELARDVMRQVRQRPLVDAKGGWLSGLSELVARRPALALASSLAVGLLAGLLVTGSSGRWLLPLDGDSISGSLLPLDDLAALPVVDEARLEAPGIRATAVTRAGRGFVVTGARDRFRRARRCHGGGRPERSAPQGIRVRRGRPGRRRHDRARAGWHPRGHGRAVLREPGHSGA